jgi:hypothetical protein
MLKKRSALLSGLRAPRVQLREKIFFFKQSLPISVAKITASHTTLIAISPRKCANLSPAPLSTSV